MSEKRAGTANQRAAPRYSTNLEVRFKSAAQFLREHATNISRGGLFVRTQKPFQVRDAVELTIWLPNGAQIETGAVVAHVNRKSGEEGVGLQFTGDRSAFRAALDGYLAELAESAEG